VEKVQGATCKAQGTRYRAQGSAKTQETRSKEAPMPKMQRWKAANCISYDFKAPELKKKHKQGPKTYIVFAINYLKFR